MKKRIFLSYLLILAMISTLMTACGKKEEAPEPLTEAVEATEVEEATEELETETVAEKTTELSGLDNGISITDESGTAADETTQSVEDDTETEPAVTPETKESVSTENTNSEPAPVAATDLPGINRNGRYPDIPESVLPADKAANMDFFDEPVKATCWIDDVEGKIYADYGMTQLIKSVKYSVDGYNDVLYIIAEDGTDSEARGIATYNGQYVVINFNMWGLWFNDLDPNYN
ncbi:MAG: hypothetical protein ACI4S2_00310 [Lachnospiraceae bacterium]